MPADIITQRLLSTLSTDWTAMEELIEVLIPLVAPGKALRKYQMNLEAQRRRKPDTVSTLTEDEQIMSGARTIVYDRISGQSNSKRIEIEKLESGDKRVRLLVKADPETGACPTCHRPFQQATEKSPPLPSPKSKVVYPTFPQWSRNLDEGSSG